MDKPSLLYASPFPPLKSGISDYSSVLVRALAEWFDVTLYIDDYDISEDSVAVFPVLRHSRDTVDFDSFAYRLYNMGNNAEYHSYIYEAALQHPGVVILHDFVLAHFIFGYYKDRQHRWYSTLYKTFGIKAFADVRAAIRHQCVDIHFMAAHPFNDELLRSDNRFLVHSEYTRQKILDTGYVNIKHIKHIKHIHLIEKIDGMLNETERETLLDQFGIPTDNLLICAFGYIQYTKLNIETARAIKALRARGMNNICYVMVGDGDYADGELLDGIVIKTGYTTLEEFNSFIDYADIIVNLRHPTMGETSGALIRAMQLGKTCIINDGGWFSEIPEDCVKRVGVDDIVQNVERSICELAKDTEERIRIGQNAKAYVEKYYGKETVARDIYDFLTSTRKD